MSVKRISMCALMCALMCVCSWISVPTTVPFTLQTFAVFFSVLMLGGLDSMISVIMFILLGVIGLPVFSGFKSGIGVILGPTGGYLVGFIAISLCALVAEKITAHAPRKTKNIGEIIALIVGLIICYLLGTVWFYIIYVRAGQSVTFWHIISICVLPYILVDGLKMALALLISKRIKKSLK